VFAFWPQPKARRVDHQGAARQGLRAGEDEHRACPRPDRQLDPGDRRDPRRPWARGVDERVAGQATAVGEAHGADSAAGEVEACGFRP
jgi:hypothetical protein